MQQGSTIKTGAKRGDGLETRVVRLGIVPLTDCAPIVIAEAKGHFRKWGL
ncbi:MAG: hypothetical protein HY246_17030, partial [Proteobacteria bacterium]|nr:hypothetical protein [Pseudomonadota bacterium]